MVHPASLLPEALVVKCAEGADRVMKTKRKRDDDHREHTRSFHSFIYSLPIQQECVPPVGRQFDLRDFSPLPVDTLVQLI